MVEYGEQLIRGLLMADGDVPEDEASAGAEALTARFSSAAAWAGIVSADAGALEGIDKFCGDQFWSIWGLRGSARQGCWMRRLGTAPSAIGLKQAKA